MERILKHIVFDYDIDDEGNYVSYAQLYFPYYSDKDKGGRVYFRNDKELDRKMRDIRELSKRDIRKLGKELLRTYSMDDMTLRDFNSMFDMVMDQKVDLGIDN